MESTVKLGNYIEKINRPNSELKYGIDEVCGITNNKEIMAGTRANLNGRTFEKFSVLYPGEFIFNRRTSRNGEKISLGYNNLDKVCILTEDYCHFKIREDKRSELNAEYLYLFFCNPEFDRYVRYNSWGSATEFFNWEDMCDVDIVIPAMSEQLKKVERIRALKERMTNLQETLDEIQHIINTLYVQWFKKYEYPPKYNLDSYSQNLIWNEKLHRDIPKEWRVVQLTDVINWIGGSQPPKSKFIYEPKDGYIRFIQNRDYGSDIYKTYIPISKSNKLCDEYSIMVDKYGDAGKTRYGIIGAYNVALAKVDVLIDDAQEYIRAYLNDDDIYTYLNETSMASTRSSLNEKNMSSLFIAIPDAHVLKAFEKMIKPFIDYSLKITEEIRKIEKLRDMIL